MESYTFMTSEYKIKKKTYMTFGYTHAYYYLLKRCRVMYRYLVFFEMCCNIFFCVFTPSNQLDQPEMTFLEEKEVLKRPK